MLNLMKAYLGLRTVSSPICHGNRRDKWLRDIEFIERQLPKRHKNLFFDSSAEEFYDQISFIKKNIETFTDEKIKVSLLSLVANIHDGHSVLMMNSKKKYPLEFFCFDDGIYLTRSSKAYSKYIGCELTHINHQSMDEIIKKIESCVSADNQQQFKNRLMDYLVLPDLLKGFDILDDNTEFTFAKNKEIFTINIEACLIDEVEFVKSNRTMLHLSNLEENYWYAHNKKDQVFYFQYNSCMQDKQSFKEFNKEMFNLIDQNKVEKLIVDLRHNGGGQSWLINPFFRALKSRPHLNKRDVLHVVIGRKTFSSAMMNTIKFMKKTQGTLVGEPTGGAPSGYGEIMFLNLRNTHLKLVYSTQYFDLMKGDFKAVEPDILIPSYSKDYFNNHDRAIEEILDQKPYIVEQNFQIN